MGKKIVVFLVVAFLAAAWFVQPASAQQPVTGPVAGSYGERFPDYKSAYGGILHCWRGRSDGLLHFGESMLRKEAETLIQQCINAGILAVGPNWSGSQGPSPVSPTPSGQARQQREPRYPLWMTPFLVIWDALPEGVWLLLALALILLAVYLLRRRKRERVIKPEETGKSPGSTTAPVPAERPAAEIEGPERPATGVEESSRLDFGAPTPSVGSLPGRYVRNDDILYLFGEEVGRASATLEVISDPIVRIEKYFANRDANETHWLKTTKAKVGEKVSSLAVIMADSEIALSALRLKAVMSGLVREVKSAWLRLPDDKGSYADYPFKVGLPIRMDTTLADLNAQLRKRSFKGRAVVVIEFIVGKPPKRVAKAAPDSTK